MATIEQTLAKVRAGADQRKAAIDEQYRDLVRKCAKGVDLSPDKIIAQLTGWGKDAVKFQADVENLAARMNLKAIADRLPEHREKLEVIFAKVQAVNVAYAADIAAANAKREEALKPLVEEERVSLAAARNAEDANRKLANLMPPPNPDLKARIDAAYARYREASQRFEFASKKMNDNFAAVPDKIKALVKRVAHASGPPAGIYSDPLSESFKREEAARHRDLLQAQEELAYFRKDYEVNERAALAVVEKEFHEARIALDAVHAEFDATAF